MRNISWRVRFASARKSSPFLLIMFRSITVLQASVNGLQSATSCSAPAENGSRNVSASIHASRRTRRFVCFIFKTSFQEAAALVVQENEIVQPFVWENADSPYNCNYSRNTLALQGFPVRCNNSAIQSLDTRFQMAYNEPIQAFWASLAGVS